MPALDPNAALTPGAQYTLTMEAGAATSVSSVDAITQELVNSNAVDLATSIQTNKQLLSVLAYDVTFTYTGDGTDSGLDVFNEFHSVLSGWFSSWTFVAIAQGTTPGTGSATGGLDLTKLVSSSSLWAIAVIALIVVFLLSGGTSVIRRVAA